jgi:dynactin 1
MLLLLVTECFGEQRKFDDCQMILKRKEKEFEETMDHLQADIDSLESERGELKEKMKNISKKAIMEGMARSSAAGGQFLFSLPPYLKKCVDLIRHA